MGFLEVFTGPVWERWAMSLIHFLWQGVLVACAAAAVLGIFRFRTAPHSRRPRNRWESP